MIACSQSIGNIVIIGALDTVQPIRLRVNEVETVG